MSTAEALVARLTGAGCRVVLAGESVKVRGPREALTPEVVAELRQRKPELVATLRQEETGVRLAAPAAQGQAGDLAERIHAHVSGCRVCRLEHFTTDAPTPCCRTGAALKVKYREARRRALEGEP
ncbi:MAG: hypothetical protein ACOY3Y_20895 [Acidobacteriota bacterium]